MIPWNVGTGKSKAIHYLVSVLADLSVPTFVDAERALSRDCFIHA